MSNGKRRRLLDGSFKFGKRYAVAIGKHDDASIAESAASDDKSGSQLDYLSKIRRQTSNRRSVEAKIAADTIRSLQKTLGKDAIIAKELLDDSRAENAPLHSYF